MLPSSLDVDQLISNGENTSVEFKRSEIFSDNYAIAREMTALSNTMGGVLLIGVTDDKQIEGMREKKGQQEHIMNLARDLCDPPLTPKFSVQYRHRGDIYVIEVSRFTYVPHALKTKEGNVYFIRAGATVRQADPTELKFLFENAAKQSQKKPDLELSLIDLSGKPTTEIEFSPVFKRVQKLKRQQPMSPTLAAIAQLQRQYEIPEIDFHSILESHPPSNDLVPINIELSNNGEAPAVEIRIFLTFPVECEVVSQSDAEGGIGLVSTLAQSRSVRGLFPGKEKNEAYAAIELLGNDLIVDSFEKVYVRFPAQDGGYLVKGSVIQHNFPPKDFEFHISIRAKFEDVVEYID